MKVFHFTFSVSLDHGQTWNKMATIALDFESGVAKLTPKGYERSILTDMAESTAVGIAYGCVENSLDKAEFDIDPFTFKVVKHDPTMN